MTRDSQFHKKLESVNRFFFSSSYGLRIPARVHVSYWYNLHSIYRYIFLHILYPGPSTHKKRHVDFHHLHHPLLDTCQRIYFFLHIGNGYWWFHHNGRFAISSRYRSSLSILCQVQSLHFFWPLSSQLMGYVTDCNVSLFWTSNVIVRIFTSHFLNCWYWKTRKKTLHWCDFSLFNGSNCINVLSVY